MAEQSKIGEYRKAVVAAVQFVVTVVTLLLASGDVIPESLTKYAVAFIALAGAYGVYRARNDRPTDGNFPV